MLVFPQWRSNLPGEGCRVPRWMPAERFAPYLARPVVLPPLPPRPQDDDEDSMGESSPERGNDSGESGESVCGWKGCGARLPNIARLSAHVGRVHAQAHRDGLFYCCWKDCARPQRGFNARYKMLVHVRTHTNERPHTCSQCQKSFSRAENLKIHLRSHSGEKPYVCPYEGCGKAYSNSSDRFKHTRTHTVDKPYCCKVPGCNKRYTDPSSLRKHVKTYKHFTYEKDKIQREPSNESQGPEKQSPLRETVPCDIQRTSPLRISSPPVVTPKLSYNSHLSPDSTSPTFGYLPKVDHVPYVPTYEPFYPIRVPIHEMSYVQYSQMYDHTYRNYYSNSLTYPVFRTVSAAADDHLISYEAPRYEDVSMSDSEIKCVEEVPLNLICSKRMEYKSIEDLVIRNDLPLDLSNKS